MASVASYFLSPIAPTDDLRPIRRPPPLPRPVTPKLFLLVTPLPPAIDTLRAIRTRSFAARSSRSRSAAAFSSYLRRGGVRRRNAVITASSPAWCTPHRAEGFHTRTLSFPRGSFSPASSFLFLRPPPWPLLSPRASSGRNPSRDSLGSAPPALRVPRRAGAPFRRFLFASARLCARQTPASRGIGRRSLAHLSSRPSRPAPPRALRRHAHHPHFRSCFGPDRPAAPNGLPRTYVAR